MAGYLVRVVATWPNGPVLGYWRGGSFAHAEPVRSHGQVYDHATAHRIAREIREDRFEQTATVVHV
jgi:hypothetical protein